MGKTKQFYFISQTLHGWWWTSHKELWYDQIWYNVIYTVCKISIALSIEINGFLTNELNDTFCEHLPTDLNRFSSLFHEREH